MVRWNTVVLYDFSICIILNKNINPEAELMGNVKKYLFAVLSTFKMIYVI